MFTENIKDKSVRKDNPLFSNLLDIFYDLSTNPRIAFESKKKEMLSIAHLLFPYLEGDRKIDKEDFRNSKNIYINNFSEQSVKASPKSSNDTYICFKNQPSEKEFSLEARNNAMILKIQMEKKEFDIITTLSCKCSWSSRDDVITIKNNISYFLQKKHIWEKIE